MATTSDQRFGVIGAGNFGIAIANTLAENGPVLLYVRRKEVVDEFNSTRQRKGRTLHPRVAVIQDLEEIARACNLIFPVVPSANFQELMAQLGPFLKPSHLLIHATKGLNVQLPEGESLSTIERLSREEVTTISELICRESVVRRVGCMSGPNLAHEIAAGQPAATVVASRFDEVIREGSAALRSGRFRVHASHDLLGIELAGVLKNIIAICSGILSGLGFGENTKALLITRGLAEIITIGKSLGADPRAFLGLAGIGDIVATCSSPRSRNFTVGYRLGQGESLHDILEGFDEVAEGVNTVCIARALANHYRFPAPITQALYRALFGDLEIERGMRLLMEYPFTEDVDFI